MVPRSTAFAVALISLAFWALDCRGASSGDGGGLAVALGVEDASGAPAREVRRGESVALRLVLTNESDASRRVTCGSARTHDASVSTAEGRELWRASWGLRYAQMLTDLSLEPGESLEFHFTWDGKTPEGAAAPEGHYVAEGWIPALDAELRAPPARFEIR